MHLTSYFVQIPIYVQEIAQWMCQMAASCLKIQAMLGLGHSLVSGETYIVNTNVIVT